MDTKKLVECIKPYMIKVNERGIDKISKYYIVHGTLNKTNLAERIEVGMAVSKGYEPLVQIILNSIPEIENRIDGSYLNIERFNFGTVYNLQKKGYETIENLLKK
jgi:hypothetical protein